MKSKKFILSILSVITVTLLSGCSNNFSNIYQLDPITLAENIPYAVKLDNGLNSSIRFRLADSQNNDGYFQVPLDSVNVHLIDNNDSPYASKTGDHWDLYVHSVERW